MIFNKTVLVYFILADGKGKNAGTVITRAREKTAGVVDLYQETDKSKSGSWFLLQTNYDPWDKPPFFDNRRDPGIKVTQFFINFSQRETLENFGHLITKFLVHEYTWQR